MDKDHKALLETIAKGPAAAQKLLDKEERAAITRRVAALKAEKKLEKAANKAWDAAAERSKGYVLEACKDVAHGALKWDRHRFGFERDPGRAADDLHWNKECLDTLELPTREAFMKRFTTGDNLYETYINADLRSEYGDLGEDVLQTYMADEYSAWADELYLQGEQEAAADGRPLAPYKPHTRKEKAAFNMACYGQRTDNNKPYFKPREVKNVSDELDRLKDQMMTGNPPS